MTISSIRVFNLQGDFLEFYSRSAEEIQVVAGSSSVEEIELKYLYIEGDIRVV